MDYDQLEGADDQLSNSSPNGDSIELESSKVRARELRGGINNDDSSDYEFGRETSEKDVAKVKKLGMYEDCSDFMKLVGEGSEGVDEESQVINQFNNDEVMLEVVEKKGMIIYQKVDAE